MLGPLPCFDSKIELGNFPGFKSFPGKFSLFSKSKK